MGRKPSSAQHGQSSGSASHKRRIFWGVLWKTSTCQNLAECQLLENSQRNRLLAPCQCHHQNPVQWKDCTPSHQAAQNLLPSGGVPSGCYPASTAADGNCLPRALSTAVFGNDSHHKELWIRITCELAVNKQMYWSAAYVAKDTHVDGEASVLFYHQSGDFVHRDLEHAYEMDVMASATNSKEMGPWQILAAATVLHWQIHWAAV